MLWRLPGMGHAIPGFGAELRGIGGLDGHQYRLDHPMGRLNRLPRYFNHWAGEHHHDRNGAPNPCGRAAGSERCPHCV